MFIAEFESDMGCDEHMGVAAIVIVHMDGQVYTHRHVPLGDMIGALGQVVDSGRAELLRGAADGDAA